MWNLHGFRAGVDAVVSVLRDLQPDALLLSECGSRRQLEHVADAVGFQAIHGALPFRFMPAARNAVLTRKDWKVIGVSGGGFTRAGGNQPRAAVVASFSVPGKRRCTLVSTHLGLEAAERAVHVDELLQMVQGVPFPAFVGGDWNDHSTGRAYRAMIDAGLRDAWAAAEERVGEATGNTYPAEAPEARIDYLFVPDERVAVKRAEVVTRALGASDHLPILVDMDWSSPS